MYWLSGRFASMLAGMSKGYGQFCPLAKAAELLCERWTMILVRELTAGSRRFNDLRRGLPLMSPTLLSRRLRQLEEAGVVRRGDEAGDSRSYQLTRAGEELRPMVEFLGAWGHRWVGSQFEDVDLDVGLLMWDIRRGVDPTQFPRERVVLQIHFPDAREGKKDWWLVSEQGETDLCMEDPGHELDLIVNCPVRVLTDIRLCRRRFTAAEQAGDLRVSGVRTDLRKKLPAWLQGSPLARLGEASLSADPITE